MLIEADESRTSKSQRTVRTRRLPTFACNRCSKHTFLASQKMSRTLCLRKGWKWTASVSLFFKIDDRCLDHCRNAGNREYRARIFLEGRPFHVAAAGLLDCVRDGHDFARPRFATE